MRDFKIVLLALAGLTTATAPALAATGADTGAESADALTSEGMGDIVISATRTAAPIDTVGSSISVLDGDDLRRLQTVQLADALATLPGVTLTRNGGFGAATTLRLRGGDPGEVKVLVDGVEVNDPSMTDNSFDFAYLTTSGIDKVEVLRGPQSALYGNDAMSGVIAITTAKPREGFSGSLMAEGGSYGTQHTQGGLAYGSQRFDASVTASELRTDGFPREQGSTHDDATLARSADVRADAQLTDALSVVTSGGWSYGNGAYDAYVGPGGQQRRDLHGRVAATYDLAAWRWSNTLSLSGARTSRSYDEPQSGYAPQSTYEGSRWALDYQSVLGLRDHDALVFGAQTKNEDSTASQTQVGGPILRTPTTAMRTDAGFAEYQADLGDGIHATAGGRVDENSVFGTHGTYRLTASWQVADPVRLRASYGTGAKAPTLFQLLDPTYGNAKLAVETSEGVDAGATVTALDGRLTVDADYFHTSDSNLIVYAYDASHPAGTYFNIAKATVQGVEMAVHYRPIDILDLQAAYTWLDSRDDTTGLTLPRRPRNSFNLAADLTVVDGLTVGADVRTLTDQVDSNYAPASVLGGYTVADLRASWAVGWGMTLFARVENLLDKHYQEVLGYNTPGRSVYGGARYQF